MNILFLHRSFPGQFKHLAAELAKNPENNVVFITNDTEGPSKHGFNQESRLGFPTQQYKTAEALKAPLYNNEIEINGIKKIVYTVEEENSQDQYFKFYEEAVIHSRAGLKMALELKNQGFNPDVIYGHTLGPVMFIKEVFPDVPFILYCEWFYKSEGDEGFDGRSLTAEDKAKLRCKNADILIDLCACDAGVSPTNWQKSRFPKSFQDKIKVLHDGIDTDICKPDEEAKFFIKDKKLELSTRDEVITYATRGMEPYRGFPVFIKAVEQLLKTRPNAHFVIAGEDKVFYGSKLTDGTFKEVMLKNADIDMNRVHFAGKLPFDEYVNLLQISSAHVYLTYPFVLSWSMLEAMSIGCCVVASSTPPVCEVIKDNYNGLLFDFYNLNQLLDKVNYALDNKDEMQTIKKAARKTIVENYSLKNLLPKHLEFIKNVKT